MSQNIRCRFAPSPTGYLHLGGARTALFNYFFAKANNGSFILRIEDTDLERSTPEAVNAIFQGLEWLGIHSDEGPFFQTKRFELYREYAQRLLASGHAYRCYATTAELDEMREAQKARNEKQRYDGRFRPKTLSPQDTALPSKSEANPFVIRFRAPQEGVTNFRDVVLDSVSTPNSELEDFIIVRSDGSPTYNFCVVVDDIDMQISHVIRGSDHVSNTPKQVAIYQALGASVPMFAHVPMILGEDKKKLSKRHGATSVIEYKKEGYLVDAFVNYLARLGWSHGDQEIFAREELERIFNLESIGKSAAVFDFQKLKWVSSEHMKTAPLETLLQGLTDFLPEVPAADPGFRELVNALRARASTLIELAEGCKWYFEKDEQLEIADAQRSKAFNEKSKTAFTDFVSRYEQISDFSEASIEAQFNDVLAKYEIGMGVLGMPVRLSLARTTQSPALFSLFTILGRERALTRLRTAQSLFN